MRMFPALVMALMALTATVSVAMLIMDLRATWADLQQRP